MEVVIRSDASLQIGTGHVMRCLTLAAGLLERGAQVQFICRAHRGHLIDLIERRGFSVLTLPKIGGHNVAVCGDIDAPEHAHWLSCDWQTDAYQCRDAIGGPVDWLIVDHYALDHRWETALRDKCHLTLCIDDLADRRHDCDLLLDQSLGRTANDYCDLVPDHAGLLLGPSYALLRPEFAQWRADSLARRENPHLRHILVTLGGVDADNVTGRVLAALRNCELPTLETITVVLGPHAPWRDQVQRLANEMTVPTRVLSGVDNMAEIMTSCDLAIGAGGSTTWERCSLGVPSVLVVMAENQRNIADYMAKSRAAFVIDAVDLIEKFLPKFLKNCQSADILLNYSQACATVSDGYGVCRVVSELDQRHK